MSDAEEREARYRRAKEVLNGAGWVFDDFVNAETAKILATPADDMTGREIAYTRARVAAELKLRLLGDVEEYEATLEINARREQMKERTNARVN